MKQQILVCRIHFLTQLGKQSGVGSTCFDKIDNSYCDFKFILDCSRQSFGGKGLSVDYTVSSNCIRAFLLYPCDKATSRTSIVGAPSAQIPISFSHWIPLASQYEATSLKTSSALVVMSIGLQNSISSSMEVDPT